MTLPAAPPLTMVQVRTEYGAPVGTPLHAFVRGGAWVPNVAQNNNVPTAPPIRLAQLCGSSKYTPMVISGPNPRNWGGGPDPKPPVQYHVTSGQSVAGGNASKTYAWTYVSGSNLITNVVNNTLAGDWYCSGGIIVGTDPPPVTATAVWRLTIHDGTGTVTRDVTFNFN